jgi:hypothetical protein
LTSGSVIVALADDERRAHRYVAGRMQRGAAQTHRFEPY